MSVEADRLVYSSLQGRICGFCGKPLAACVCRSLKKEAVPSEEQAARLRYEKSAKGKGMTLISGLGLSESGLLDLSRRLKRRFGTGGSVKGYVIELQGDFRRQAEDELRKMGIRIK